MSDVCPSCGEDLEYQVSKSTYSRKIGVEIWGMYDGVLFWQCPLCDHRWHRWPEGHPLRERAGKAMAIRDEWVRRRAEKEAAGMASDEEEA